MLIKFRSNDSIECEFASMLTLPGLTRVSMGAAIKVRLRGVAGLRDSAMTATAAKTALTLHKLGVKRVRPLRGGFDEWKRLGYPMDAIEPVIPETPPLVQLGN